MSRSLHVTLALAALSLAVAAPAHAVLITVNFTVTGDPTDPVNNGVTANGSFSFDSSIIPPGGGGLAFPTTSGFNLTWDGTAWNDANTHFGEVLNGLIFNSAGELTNWVVFGEPFPDLPPPNDPDRFSIFAFNGTGDFVYHNFGTDGGFIGTVTWSYSPQPPYPVAEPGTLALFAPGMLALGLVRRRKS